VYFSGEAESWAIPKGFHRKSPGKGNRGGGLVLFLRLWLPMKNLLLPLDIAKMQKNGT
jgi:hypothetical protein